MNKRKVEEYIKKAIKVLDNPIDGKNEFFLRRKKDAKIPKEYKGYIDSFGATIINNGLLGAIAIYSNTGSNSKQDKVEIIQILERVLDLDSKKEDLFKYAKNYEEDISIKKNIINATIGLKLALRTYEFTE